MQPRQNVARVLTPLKNMVLLQLAALITKNLMSIDEGELQTHFELPYSNRISPLLTEFGPLLWQAKQTVSAPCQLQPAT